MAAGLGYKEFATGDVLTAADANGYLASQVVMVFASAAARTSAIASPQEGMISYLKDTNSTEYYSGSTWAAVGGGGGGKVLQVVSVVNSTAITSSSSYPSFANSGITLSITPSATTSKILLLASIPMMLQNKTDLGGATRITRASGATIVYPQNALYNQYCDGIGNSFATTHAISFLDSPSTTSAITYEIQFCQSSGGSSTATLSFNGQTTSLVAMEIGA